MADVGALRELHAFMREVNASYAKCGELELRLDPLPPTPAPAIEAAPAGDPDADDRRSLETLLHSTSADPEFFLRAIKRSA